MSLFKKLIIELLQALLAEEFGPPVRGRFAGAYTTTPKGEIIVAMQQLTVNTPFTCPLIFQDANGNNVPGPAGGSVSSSDPTVQVALSADGQAVNATMTAANITSTLTWSGTGANGPFSFTTDVTDQSVAGGPVSGQFGSFVPGTTP